MRRRLPRRAAPGHHSDLRMLRRAYRLQRRVATLTALGCFTAVPRLSAEEQRRQYEAVEEWFLAGAVRRRG